MKKIIKTLYRTVFMSPAKKRFTPWFRDNGDKTLRMEYGLNEKSVVFDLGGFEGQWASDIFSRYCCWIHIFEPVEEFALNIEKRFARNNKILVHKFGLSNENTEARISVEQDGSSTFKGGKNGRDIRLVKAVDFMRENHITHIDLMKINIEGGEYDLLDHLIETGFIKDIDNIQVQFHDFVPNAEQRMTIIQEKLNNTHELTYQYPFVWENWAIRQ